MKKKALGRGLGALLSDSAEAEPAPSEIDIDQIALNPAQPRFRLDDKGLDELAASIREHGMLQPILIRPWGNGYQLIAGERRMAAAQRAGLLKVPAVVRAVPDERLLELALIENIQREQLNPIEESQAFQNLGDTLTLTQEELALRLGKERSTIANSLRLLKLPPAVKDLVAEGKLSPGHGRALLASNASPSEMIRIASTMVAQSWSVRDAERWAKSQSKIPRVPRSQEPNEAAAADRLRLMFGAKVEIRSNQKGRGQIQIHFADAEDLVRIYSILIGQGLRP